MDTQNVTALTSEQIAAEYAARKKKRAKEKQLIKKTMEVHNVRFLTVGDYTICYRAHHRSVIELSTAIRHPNDRTDRHYGRMQALLRFNNNNRIILKNKGRRSNKRFLADLFDISHAM